MSLGSLRIQLLGPRLPEDSMKEPRYSSLTGLEGAKKLSDLSSHYEQGVAKQVNDAILLWLGKATRRRREKRRSRNRRRRRLLLPARSPARRVLPGAVLANKITALVEPTSAKHPQTALRAARGLPLRLPGTQPRLFEEA